MQYLFVIIFSLGVLSQDKRFQEERENSVIDYSSIRTILKTDGLDTFQNKKTKKLKKIIKEKRKIEKQRSSYPNKDNFFSFFSRYWLAKKASLLRWDFAKPDYGIADHFKLMLEKVGLIDRKFSVLVINTPQVTHFALPSDPKEYIFIISLPFMKALDLSKEDISLILLEDMLRIDKKIFINAIDMDLSFIGKEITVNKDKLLKQHSMLLNEYDRVIYERGFSFQEQYKITKLMDSYLKPEPVLWSAYIRLLNKINKLIKSNLLFKSYNKIYPSPQMQIKWLSPPKKVL